MSADDMNENERAEIYKMADDYKLTFVVHNVSLSRDAVCVHDYVGLTNPFGLIIMLAFLSV